MQFSIRKHPAVCVGLAASFGLLASFSAFPTQAYAEELVAFEGGQSTDSVLSCISNGSAEPSEEGGTQGSQQSCEEGVDLTLAHGDTDEYPSDETTGVLVSDRPGESSCEGGLLPGQSIDHSDGIEAGSSADEVPTLDRDTEIVAATSEAASDFDEDSLADSGAKSDSAAVLPESGWVVRNAGDGSGLQRYYQLEDGYAKGVFRAILAGAEYWFYALEDGRVVRGKWDDGAGRVYLADNDGRLAALGEDGCASGWLITGIYDDGVLQRYYIDGATHAAVSGYYTVDASGSLHEEGGPGDSYFGLGGEGYVLRGMGRGVRSDWLVADNDGKLAKNEWIVTSAFGQGLQRYWFDSTATIAKEGVYHTGGGSWTYVTDAGYVLRGKLDSGYGCVYLANNDGVLASLGSDGNGSGWIVTGEYDSGVLQRYYIDGTVHAALSGFFKDGGSTYFGLGNQGYVLRGRTSWGNQVLLANNDGVMAYGEGWLVSDDYGQGLQRYWIEGITGQSGYYGAKTGFFHIVDGHAVSGRASDGAGYYYGRSEGYVLRGSMNVNGEYIIADNDGVIAAYLNGIDISNWQKDMDVSKIASNFIIVKVSEGADYLNPSFRRFADAVLAAGKQLGLYHFYHTEASPEEQADFFVSQVRPYLGQAVLVLDWEDTTGSNAIAQGPSVAKRFLDRVYEQTDVRSLIYMSSSVTRSYDWSSVANSGYGLWVAQYLYKYYDTVNGINGYVQNPTLSDGDFGAWGRDVTMYQYTSTGKLDGWSGFLDFNVFYGTKDDWQALATPAVRAATAAVRAVASASIVTGDGSQDAIEV